MLQDKNRKFLLRLRNVTYAYC